MAGRREESTWYPQASGPGGRVGARNDGRVTGRATFRRRTRIAASLSAVGAMIALAGPGASPAEATCAGGTTSWTNASGGDFTVDGNWDNGAPGTDGACDAVITLPGTYTVTLGVSGGADNRTVNSLTLGGSSGTQTLEIRGVNGTGNSNLTVDDGDLTNNANGAIVLDCATLLSCASPGLVTLQVSSGTLTNSGTLTTSGLNAVTAELGGNVTNNGTIQVDDSATYIQGTAPSPVTLTNQGALTIADGESLSTGQTVTNGSGGAIQATGSGMLEMLGSGTFNQGAGTTSGTTPVIFDSGGGTLNFTGTGASSFLVAKGGSFGLSGDVGSSQSLTIKGQNGTGNTAVTAATGFANAGSIVLGCQVSCASPGLVTLQVSSGTLTNSGTLTTSGLNAVTAELGGNVTNNGTIQVDDSATYIQGTAPSPVTLTNQGALTIADGESLSTGQTVTNGSGGAIQATGSGMLEMLGSGTFNQGAGTTSGTTPVIFDSGGGTLNFTGTGASSFLVAKGGSFGLSGDVGSSQSLTIKGQNGTGNTAVTAATGFANAGSIVLGCQVSCASPGLVTLQVSSGTLTNSGTLTTSGLNALTAELGGNVTNSGSLQIADGAATIDGGSFNQTSGTTTVASGQTLSVTGATGGQMNLAGGSLTGSGAITGTVSNTGGTVAPGSSPGTLTLTGDYSQGAGGNMDVEVNGTGGGQFDVLSVGGDATLGGTLTVIPNTAYAAAAQTGDEFAFLDYAGTRTGQFATTTVAPPLNGHRPVTPAYVDASTLVKGVVGPKSQHTLTVSKSGSGGGSVSSSPAGIACGATCAAPFDEGTPVTLSAAAASGSKFTGWSGGGCSGTGTCQVTMSSGRAVTASFAALPPNTKIKKAKINGAKRKATFKFKAIAPAKGKAGIRFQCALKKKKHKQAKLKFKRCKSPYTYKHLKRSKYVFEVRAVGAPARTRRRRRRPSRSSRRRPTGPTRGGPGF